ncbi:hypothetical protein [Paenarthrobacter nitroguajacolicus]|uniref:hypothetical protein n=1 Tax=Paenarthrobacter nitroguajacolicus TaxID=211146 RepID=UPI004053BCBE
MIDEHWLLILVQVPAQPSWHRVAVWRAGAVPLSPGTWLLPAHPRWYEDLKSRDVLHLPQATEASERSARCADAT